MIDASFRVLGFASGVVTLMFCVVPEINRGTSDPFESEQRYCLMICSLMLSLFNMCSLINVWSDKRLSVFVSCLLFAIANAYSRQFGQDARTLSLEIISKISFEYCLAF